MNGFYVDFGKPDVSGEARYSNYIIEISVLNKPSNGQLPRTVWGSTSSGSVIYSAEADNSQSDIITPASTLYFIALPSGMYFKAEVRGFSGEANSVSQTKYNSIIKEVIKSFKLAG